MKLPNPNRLAHQLPLLAVIIALFAVAGNCSAQISPDHLTIWYKASDVEHSGGSAFRWNGWGNNDALQITETAQPTLQTDAVNALPAVTFDSNDWMEFSGTVADGAAQSMQVFVVAKTDSAVSGFKPLISTGDQNGWILRYDGINLEYVHPDGSTTNPKVVLTNPSPSSSPGYQIIEVERQGLSVALRVNGDNVGSGQATATLASYTVVPGGDGSSRLGRYRSSYLNGGSIAEVIIYDQTTGSAGREIVLNYLADKYNIALVQPPAPGGKVTSPLNQTTYGQTQQIPLQASTFSTVGGGFITKAEFFANGAKIHEVSPTNSPTTWTTPTFNWVAGEVNEFDIEVKITASNLVARWSPPIHIETFNEPPAIAAGPSATQNPTITNSTTLSVTATDDRATAELTYKWIYAGVDPGLTAPTFSPNNSNGAQNTTVTFGGAGEYPIRLEVRDQQGGVTLSDIFDVTVERYPATILVAPQVANLTYGVKQKFTVSGVDQFGGDLVESPVILWGLSSGTAGSFDSTLGILTVGTVAQSGVTVTATKAHWVLGGGISPDSPQVRGTATININAPPASLDTDGDGLTDLYELATSYAGTKYTSVNLFDSDFDGISDGWEVANSLNPTNPSDAQGAFGNGLTCLQEFRRQTSLPGIDSNGDGLYDSIASAVGRDPNTMDSDGDGWTNAQELLVGTQPFLADTDGDDRDDPFDFYPLDSSRWDGPSPVSGDTTGPTVTLSAPTGATLN